MNFSVPTNWQKELLPGLFGIDKNREIKEIYGKLAMDGIGGGRAASSVAFVSKKNAGIHIGKIYEQGFKFNYLINTLCMDNLEFTSKGQRRFTNLFEWFMEVGIDSVTVANPYLAMWIKRKYPSVSINVSAMAGVDSLKKAKFWEGLGVEKITFPGPMVNRNFRIIKEIRSKIKCKMQLVANNSCLCNCSSYISHALMNSHASQNWHSCRGYMFDHHIIMCRFKRLKDPVNFICSDWIRPEDVAYYEKIGIDSIKLVDRRLSTDKILYITSAYLDKKYNGNLLDLFHTFGDKSFNAHRGWVYKILYLFNPLSMNIFKILKFSKILSKMDVAIDNRQLDDFIENIPESCDLFSCDSCGYCKKTADRVVKINPNALESMLCEYQKVIDSVLKNGLK